MFAALGARRLPCAAAAVLAIAATFPGATGSSAAGSIGRHRPPPRPPAQRARTLPPVSAGTPYIAPWQSAFERYSTQLLVPNAASSSIRSLTIPRGQWWRLVYQTFAFTTSAVAGNRYIWYYVREPAGGEVYRQAMPFVAVASNSYFFTVGPGLTSYTLPAAGGVGGATVGIPDMLWRENYSISIEITGIQAGDAFATTPNQWAVEVFTPVKDRPGVLVPTPLQT